MCHKSDKRRVMITLPSKDLELFREKAQEMNLTFSQYVYLSLKNESLWKTISR